MTKKQETVGVIRNDKNEVVLIITKNNGDPCQIHTVNAVDMESLLEMISLKEETKIA